MSDEKKSQVQSYEERRKMERFAWLGPMLERRKTPVEPLREGEENGEELEELESGV